MIFVLELLNDFQNEVTDLKWSIVYDKILNNLKKMTQQEGENIEFQVKFIYKMVDRTAMKIAVLIKIARLPYILDDTSINEEAPYSYVLQTQQGELTKQYEIINYIIHESKELARRVKSLTTVKQQQEVNDSSQIREEKDEGVIDLAGDDPYVTVKMQEKLFQLRNQMFPLFHQFYKYLTGFQKTKKGKYDSLMNKIKKEIGSLDSYISENPQLFPYENNFLTIIIACEMFMACKFVFEQKFRKSKYTLFTKFEKLSHRKEFVEIYGKSQLCLKEYVPTQFEEQEVKPRKKEEPLPSEIQKLSDTVLHTQPSENNRNELLYNYFRTQFNQQNEQKKKYFPYFWMMFEDLSCSLVQIISPLENGSQEAHEQHLQILSQNIKNLLKVNIDYGMIGLYQQQQDTRFMIRGILCVGSRSFEQFQNVWKNSVHGSLQDEEEREEVQHLWEHVVENQVYENILLCLIKHI